MAGLFPPLRALENMEQSLQSSSLLTRVPGVAAARVSGFGDFQSHSPPPAAAPSRCARAPHRGHTAARGRLLLEPSPEPGSCFPGLTRSCPWAISLPCHSTSAAHRRTRSPLTGPGPIFPAAPRHRPAFNTQIKLRPPYLYKRLHFNNNNKKPTPKQQYNPKPNKQRKRKKRRGVDSEILTLQLSKLLNTQFWIGSGKLCERHRKALRVTSPHGRQYP